MCPRTDEEFTTLENELNATKAELAKARKTATTDEEVEEIDEAQGKVKKIQKRREISGMSESTAHALLEETRALRSDLMENGILPNLKSKPASGAPDPKAKPVTTSAREEWSLSDLFFGKD